MSEGKASKDLSKTERCSLIKYYQKSRGMYIYGVAKPKLVVAKTVTKPFLNLTRIGSKSRLVTNESSLANTALKTSGHKRNTIELERAPAKSHDRPSKKRKANTEGGNLSLVSSLGASADAANSMNPLGIENPHPVTPPQTLTEDQINAVSAFYKTMRLAFFNSVDVDDSTIYNQMAKSQNSVYNTEIRSIATDMITTDGSLDQAMTQVRFNFRLDKIRHVLKSSSDEKDSAIYDEMVKEEKDADYDGIRKIVEDTIAAEWDFAKAIAKVRSFAAYDKMAKEENDADYDSIGKGVEDTITAGWDFAKAIMRVCSFAAWTKE
jgi:hypothetical protein